MGAARFFPGAVLFTDIRLTYHVRPEKKGGKRKEEVNCCFL